MNVGYTETALQEIESILSYIANDNESAAAKAALTIAATINRLTEFPHAAVQTDVPGVRVTPILPYRYLMFFTVLDDLIIILNVRHSRRDDAFLR